MATSTVTNRVAAMAAMTGTPAVVCRGLVKRYEDLVAVNGVDLEVRAGEGLLARDAGDVRILGLTWDRDERELRQRLGVQLQETLLAEKLTVEETIRLFRSFFREGKTVDEVIDAVQLQEKRKTWVGKLSGGQKQRLSVACALVGDPDLLFLDEPTTGLDPQSRRALWELVEHYLAGGGTVLLTTHYMEEAERLCDRVAIMDHGQIIALGTPEELIASLDAEHIVEFSVEHGSGLPDREALLRLAGVTNVTHRNGATQLTVTEPHVAVPALLGELERQGAALAGLSTHHATLEDVFVAHTGRHLRDE
jgi:ABC-2 type transport system ATP-binding protein